MTIEEFAAMALREEAGRCLRSIHGEYDRVEKLNEIIADLRGQINELRQREQDMIVAHQAARAALERIPQRLCLNGKYNGKYKTRDGRVVDVTPTVAFPHGVAFILGVCHEYDPNGLATLLDRERRPGADLVELIQERRG